MCFLKGQNDIPMSKSFNGKSSNIIFVYDIYVDAAFNNLVLWDLVSKVILLPNWAGY